MMGLCNKRFALAQNLALTLLLTAVCANAAHVKVLLLGGQSNMAGRAPASGLPAELQLPQDDVLFYYASSLTTLRPGSGTDFGPEVTFGRTIADAMPSNTYCLIKYAVGGTSLDMDWDPATGATYSAFRTKVTNGLAALTGAGHTYEIVGMLWNQGERDAKTGRTAAQYEADLIEFVADIRARYGANLPFFLSRLSANQTNMNPTQLTNIRTGQENFAVGDAFAWMIDTDSMSVQGDNLHFDAPGQIAMGEAFGGSYIATLSGGPGGGDGPTLIPTTVPANAVPGTIVGTFTYAGTNDQSGITYALVETNDFDAFFITGTTNLRTRSWISKSSYEIAVAASKAGMPLATSNITVQVTAAPTAPSVFEVEAATSAGIAPSNRLVAMLSLRTGSAAPAAFAVSGGRDDLFAISGATNLVQVGGGDAGAVGSTHYVEVTGSTATASRSILIAVEVVSGASNGLLSIGR